MKHKIVHLSNELSTIKACVNEVDGEKHCFECRLDELEGTKANLLSKLSEEETRTKRR